METFGLIPCRLGYGPGSVAELTYAGIVALEEAFSAMAARQCATLFFRTCERSTLKTLHVLACVTIQVT